MIDTMTYLRVNEGHNSQGSFQNYIKHKGGINNTKKIFFFLNGLFLKQNQNVSTIGSHM